VRLLGKIACFLGFHSWDAYMMPNKVSLFRIRFCKRKGCGVNYFWD
jgi:hypothetical protein